MLSGRLVIRLGKKRPVSDARICVWLLRQPCVRKLLGSTLLVGIEGQRSFLAGAGVDEWRDDNNTRLLGFLLFALENGPGFTYQEKNDFSLYFYENKLPLSDRLLFKLSGDCIKQEVL